MSELMLINPRKRRRKRKMSAKQRKYFGKRRRKNPLYGALAANPHRRKRRSYAMKSRGRKRYRRSPIGFKPMRFVNDTLMPSTIGAAGALGLDLLMGFVPLPAMLQGAAIRPLVRIAGAVGIGMLAGMVSNKRMGEQVGAGALTVVLYDTLKGFARTTFPTLNLGDIENDYPMMEYIAPAPQVEDLGEYVGTDFGEYVGTDYSPTGNYNNGTY